MKPSLPAVGILTLVITSSPSYLRYGSGSLPQLPACLTRAAGSLQDLLINLELAVGGNA